MTRVHTSNLRFHALFFSDDNHADMNDEAQDEDDEEEDLNLEDKSDFEKQQILVNTFSRHFSRLFRILFS